MIGTLVEIERWPTNTGGRVRTAGRRYRVLLRIAPDVGKYAERYMGEAFDLASAIDRAFDAAEAAQVELKARLA